MEGRTSGRSTRSLGAGSPKYSDTSTETSAPSRSAECCLGSSFMSKDPPGPSGSSDTSMANPRCSCEARGSTSAPGSTLWSSPRSAGETPGSTASDSLDWSSDWGTAFGSISSSDSGSDCTLACASTWFSPLDESPSFSGYSCDSSPDCSAECLTAEASRRRTSASTCCASYTEAEHHAKASRSKRPTCASMLLLGPVLISGGCVHGSSPSASAPSRSSCWSGSG